MKRVICVLSLLMFLAFATLVLAVEFKPYPGAAIDQKATKEATELVKQAGMARKATIYTTSDSFEKVYAFYQGIAKDYGMPSHKEPLKLPSGEVLKEAYFIFDGVADIMSSKLWIKIQRPYIGRVEMGKDFQVKYEDVRDITAITVSEQK